MRSAFIALLILAPSFGLIAEERSPVEKEMLFKCGRCHVIGDLNKYGGIGSTPSFRALRGFDDWRERFSVFYTLNPHPAFTQVAGVTPPFPASRPSPIAPIEVTTDEIERFTAYVQDMEPFE